MHVHVFTLVEFVPFIGFYDFEKLQNEVSF